MSQTKVHFDYLFEVNGNRITCKVSMRFGNEIVGIGTVYPTGIGPNRTNLKDYIGRNLWVEQIGEVYEIKGITGN